MIRRSLAFGVLALSALVLQSTLASVMPATFVPDLILILVIVSALYLDPLPGLALAFALGYGADLLSAAPMGHHALLRMLAFSVTALVCNQFHLGRASTLALFTLAVSVADAAGTAGLSLLFSARFPIGWGVLRDVLILALSNAVFAPMVSSLVRSLIELVSENEVRRSVRLAAGTVRR
jgi:rod shape-determining protein MreD